MLEIKFSKRELEELTEAELDRKIKTFLVAYNAVVIACAKDWCVYGTACQKPHCGFKHPKVPLETCINTECRFGVRCKFAHANAAGSTPATMAPCKYAMCDNPNCKFNHVNWEEGGITTLHASHTP